MGGRGHHSDYILRIYMIVHTVVFYKPFQGKQQLHSIGTGLERGRGGEGERGRGGEGERSLNSALT